MKPKILLIEADRPLAVNLIEFLKDHNIEVQWHVDPQLAITSIDEQRPNIVIMDMVLAGRSGTEFLYELRSYGDLQELPVIVYSSISDRELGYSDKSLSQLNVAEFLYKPESSFSQLLKTLNKFVASSQSAVSLAAVQ